MMDVITKCFYAPGTLTYEDAPFMQKSEESLEFFHSCLTVSNLQGRQGDDGVLDHHAIMILLAVLFLQA